jgi:cation diffusion facilitator family transporter
VAAISIGVTAIGRLMSPKPLEQIGLGLAVSVVASMVNLGVALILLRVAKRHDSITLEANAHHLMTDVWTSAGVLVGVGAVAVTGWQRLDPLVALVVAGNIVWSGFRIVGTSVSGLMDAALPADEQEIIRRVLELHGQSEIEYHALRTRRSGARRFVSFHLLVPGTWTVERGHQLLEGIEGDLLRALPNVTVFTHLESSSDPASWKDVELDRSEIRPVDPPAAHEQRQHDKSTAM